MNPTSVTEAVETKIDITTQILNSLKDFALTKGIDICVALIIFGVGWFICRQIRRVVEHVLDRSNVDPSAKTFVSEVVFFFCLAIVAIVALGTAGVGAGTLAAAFGGIGLAIGLGLKENIGNVASGIFILIFRPFKVGDYIKVGSNDGTVKEITIMYTYLSTLGNQVIVIPNSSLTSSVIKNYSAFDTRNVEYTFGVGYDTDLKECVELLRDLFMKSPYVIDKNTILIYVASFGDSAINIYVRATVDRTKYFEALNALFIEVKDMMDAHHIDIPFPQVVVHQADK